MTTDTTFAQTIVRTMREIGTTPDPLRPNYVLVNTKDLEAVIEEHFDEYLSRDRDETPPPSTHVLGDPVGLKPIPIEAAKRIAKEYGYDQVLIYGRRCHDTPEPHGEHMTTYGRTREHCDVAARIGDTLKKFMGWEV